MAVVFFPPFSFASYAAAKSSSWTFIENHAETVELPDVVKLPPKASVYGNRKITKRLDSKVAKTSNVIGAVVQYKPKEERASTPLIGRVAIKRN